MKTIIVVILFAVVLLGGAGLFYWYEWRPSETRKDCYRFVQVLGGFTGEVSEDGLPSFKMLPLQGEQAETAYKNCLREHGLEK